MNQAKSGHSDPRASGVRRLITRSGLASILAIICTVAMAANTLANNGLEAYCYDSTANRNYISTAGLNPQAFSPFWYASIQTSNYATEGIKGNISTAGGPYTFNNTYEHVDGYLAANEHVEHRWIQVGWHIGELENCQGGSGPRNGLEVYIEIFDDSVYPSSPCTIAIVTAAPSIASYDTRYYSQVGTLYRYQIYFEVPGSGNIQDLGWGDYTYLVSVETAAGEALADSSTHQAPWPMCPVLGDISSNHWNYFGQQASQSTFAAELQLYNNGSWSDWTSSIATRQTATPPYQRQFISSYTEFKNGGGQE